MTCAAAKRFVNEVPIGVSVEPHSVLAHRTFCAMNSIPAVFVDFSRILLRFHLLSPRRFALVCRSLINALY